MIQLKNFILDQHVIQSPMAGCTDLAFRLVAREYGMPFAFLEMVSADALVRENHKTSRLLKTVPEDKPLGAQLVGCNPEIMAEAAAMIEAMGFDLLDLNLGCPVPKVTGPGGGSALLAEPETAKQIFEKVVKSVKNIPVTVKMRKGFSDPSGNEAVRIARMAEDAGVSAVTIHGRTRTQGYSGIADWEAIGKVKKAVRIPVFGNGDVQSGDDAKRLIEVSGCDGVMIGRSGLGNPWIYRAIDARLNEAPAPVEPTVADRKKAVLKHLELEVQNEGERVGVLKFRRIACWYFKNYIGAAEFRSKVNAAVTADEMRQILSEFNPPDIP